MKTPLLLSLATALGLPLASAQDDRKPENPPRPPDAERPAGPRPEGQRERRPEGDRPSPGSPERGRPDGERTPDQQRRGDRPRPDETNPEARKPDGPRAEGDRRDGPRPEGRNPDAQRPEGDRRDGLRPEGDRQDGPGRDRPRAQAPANPPRPQKPTAYLGVVTATAQPSLAAQIGLPEGFGLVVEEVVPESPAARAGVQRFDVLKQINDQQLIDPNQLAALVRSYGKDAEVSLTVLRKGVEQKLSVKVGERPLPERRGAPAMGGEMMRNIAPMRQRPGTSGNEMQERVERYQKEFGERMKNYNEQMKDFGNRMREFQERAGKGLQNPGGSPPQPPRMPEPPKPPTPPRFDSSFEPAPADVLKEVRPGGAPGIRVEQDGKVTVWNTANARAVMKDDDGEVELRSADGKRTVTARAPGGEVIFTGPIDTEAQRAALPEGVRRKLDRMNIRNSIQSGAASASASVDVAPEIVEVDVDIPASDEERDIQ